jgi:hypothetical protein
MGLLRLASQWNLSQMLFFFSACYWGLESYFDRMSILSKPHIKTQVCQAQFIDKLLINGLKNL